MSSTYLKNTIIRNFSIEGIGNEVSMVGKDIITILDVNCYECLYEPFFHIDIRFVATEGVFSNLKLRGTERASLLIEHPTGNIAYDDLFITKFVQTDSDSVGNIVSVTLQTEHIVNNETQRCYEKYDNSGNISSHVEKICKTHLKASELDIEQTANSYGFYGNNWRPARTINWLANRSISKSMSEDGSGTERVGYCFWQSYRLGSKFNFKSLDTMISSNESDVLTFTQNEVVDPGIDENFNAYNIFFEKEEDIIESIQDGQFGSQTINYNIHTLDKSETINKSKSQISPKQSHLGTEDELKVNSNFSIEEKAPLKKVQVIVDGTQSDEIKDGENPTGEYNPHKIVDQNKIRHKSLTSKSLRVTIPYNMEVGAGEIINLKLIKSNEGTDSYLSGHYMVKDCCHSVDIKKGQSLTHLRCIRDYQGDVE